MIKNFLSMKGHKNTMATTGGSEFLVPGRGTSFIKVVQTQWADGSF